MNNYRNGGNNAGETHNNNKWSVIANRKNNDCIVRIYPGVNGHDHSNVCLETNQSLFYIGSQISNSFNFFWKWGDDN